MGYAKYKLGPLFILIVAFLIALYFIFRKRNIKPALVAQTDKQMLQANVEFYQNLSVAEKLRFEDKIADFLGAVKIEGIGMEVTQLDRLLVAASAVIPIFGFDNWRYKNLGTVILYPDTFNKDFQFEGGDRNIGGMVGTGYMNGQMVLSSAALKQGFSKNAGKENTGIHEFVHLLDKSDGSTDGIPENFLSKQYVLPWVKMMHQELKAIDKDQSDVNPYALTNEAEFFAVVAEYFFEQPASMEKKHPELYQLLTKVFAQDPAA